jgi:predicted Holliday junction resolvase-like endonuclease
MRIAGLIVVALMLNGCVAQLAADVITAPIKVVGKTADVLTTSQEEADRNRGRKMRKAEERAEKDRKREEKAARKARREAEDGGY